MRTLIILLCFMSMLGCQKDPNSEVLPEPSNPNLKYFGFTLVDVFFDDPSDDSSKTNYSDEVAPFSNLADILVVNPDQDIVSNLEIMDAFEMKAYLHLNELFFEITSEGGDKSGVIYSLRSDYRERWDEFIKVNSMDLNAKYIEAFYIGEEPFWNGITFEEFKMACDYLKETVPQVNVLMVEAYAALEEMQIPESVDWVGFDRYFVEDPSSDTEYLSELDLLMSKRSNEQKVMLILDSHFLPVFHRLGGIRKNELDEVARSYYRLANSQSEIIGIIGYFWPSGFDFPNSTGARGLPDHVKNEYERIGKAITRK